MTDRLSIYNGALAVLGERKLADLTENREPRYKLDDIWDRDFVQTVLEQGQWNFATRSVELSYSPSVSPSSFGLKYGFEQPSDMVRVTGVCSDEWFNSPLLNYRDEAGYWWSDLETLYVAFVSDGASYGGNYSLWPKNFTRYAETFLAAQAARTIMGASVDIGSVNAELKEWLKRAKATDAMKESARFLPPSSWVRSRQGGQGDRGSRTLLIG